MSDQALLAYSNQRLMALRDKRYSWWAHAQELAQYFLPRRYRWFITPNASNRGSPINQHIIDSTGVIAARNLASGLLSGKSSPTRPWFKLRIGHIDSTQTNPVSLWLAECERIMYLIFHESNFYNSIATFYFDLVIFGTAVMLIYEDFENVINCYNPCFGEFYVDIDGKYRPRIMYREFTMTVDAVVGEFGYDNCSQTIRNQYDLANGAGKGKEVIIAHSIEPNVGNRFGFHEEFLFREVYWEWGSSNNKPGSQVQTCLRKKGYYELPMIIVRWDTVSNDAYGRSPAMDGLGDQKQLQQETKRKAQAVDKMLNPPLVGDIQLRNQPTTQIPGGITYVTGYAATGKPGLSSIYDTKFPVGEVTEDLKEVRERLKKIFFNDLFQTASQYETRSNVTAIEWDMRKAESLIMLGPVLDRIDHEGLAVATERVFAITARTGVIFPPPPTEIAGKNIDIQFVSMLQTAQAAAQSAGIERVLGLAGNIAGLDPSVMDKVDIDYSLDKYSTLLNNDPRMMRSNEAVTAIREARAKQQAQMQQAEMAEKMAAGAKVLSETQTGAGQNALQQITGI